MFISIDANSLQCGQLISSLVLVLTVIKGLRYMDRNKGATLFSDQGYRRRSGLLLEKRKKRRSSDSA